MEEKEDNSACPNRLSLDPRVEKAFELIWAEPCRRLSEVARMVGLSQSRLQHLIRIRKHVSFRQVRSQARVGRAIHLLERTTLSVKEISARLGYSHPPAFVRAFRRSLGKMPLEWRNSAESGNEIADWDNSSVRDLR